MPAEVNNLEFFGYNSDQLKVLELLFIAKRGGKKVLLMAAPSFVVDFDYKTFVPTMKALGFDKVTELTFGAKIVNEHYHKYVQEKHSRYALNGKKKDAGFQEKFIASVCPASVDLVKNKHPELKKYLLPFDSPMSAMGKIVRKNFPKHAIVFLAPCSAKKSEASKLFLAGEKLIEGVVTFAEMKQIVAKEKPQINPRLFADAESAGFDSFYNDYTKIYPLSGGLSNTLHYKGLLHKNQMVSCDGCTDLQKLFSKHSDKVFYDVLFCEGGCIGGNGVASRAPLFMKKRRVLEYKAFSAKEKMNGKQGLEKYTKGINFEKEI